ncbi:MAG: DNA internalization-related competence protein ComEC/Rec2 [Porticoccaceae bacterium]
MRYLILSLPLGIFAPVLLPVMPNKLWFYLLLLIALAARYWFKASRYGSDFFIGFAIGIVIGGLWGHWQLDHRLPQNLDKIDVLVTGKIYSLPETDGQRSRFRLAVDTQKVVTGDAPINLRKLMVSWYGAPSVKAGERWQLMLRLRSPRGFSNPGGFDYSGWLLAEGVSATGYVRSHSLNQRLGQAEPLSLLGLRQLLLDRLRTASFDAEVTGFMAALILGDNSLISPASFNRLIASGTVHLMVVSGLHVGMVAGICFLAGMLVGKVLAALGSRVPAPIIAAVVAALGATGYAAIAGFGLPAQRALVMALVVLVALLARRRSHPAQTLGWALCGVALVDPLAVIRPGFWLSFIAVAGLLAWFVPRPRASRWRGLLAAQVVVLICLAPFLLFFQGNVSLMALPVNLVVIPWISVSVVPLCLLGAVFQFVPVVGDALWQCAAWQLAVFNQLLLWLDQAPSSLWQPGYDFFRRGDFGLLVAAMLMAVLWLLPEGLGSKTLAGILLLAVVLSRPQEPPLLKLAVLDIGQGLATVVQVADKTLVYDAGPSFSPAFNTGAAVVAPYLSVQGVKVIDTLVVSHGDNDHAGGVFGLLSLLEAENVYASEPMDIEGASVQSCEKGISWIWHDVRFSFLWPQTGVRTQGLRTDNNHSCVLLIEGAGQRILLPGDIEKEAESEIINQMQLAGVAHMPLSVLVAAHHGSKTSSSEAFVRFFNSAHVVFSSGFNHHFGHPHREVVARFRQQGAELWQTSSSGAVIFSWSEGEQVTIVESRKLSPRYWH